RHDVEADRSCCARSEKVTATWKGFEVFSHVVLLRNLKVSPAVRPSAIIASVHVYDIVEHEVCYRTSLLALNNCRCLDLSGRQAAVENRALATRPFLKSQAFPRPAGAWLADRNHGVAASFYLSCTVSH